MIIKLIYKIKNFLMKRYYDINTSDSLIKDLLNSRDIESFEKCFLQYLSFINKDKTKVSAVYRLKNCESTLFSSFISLCPIIDEFIFVNNNSDDNTMKEINRCVSVCEELNIKYKVSQYSINLAKQGSSYCDSIKINPEMSLAKYYNYCFDLASNDIVMKADANMLFLPKSYKAILKKLENNDLIQYRGINFVGRKMGFETYIYNKKILPEYLDGDFCEYLPTKSVYSLKEIYLSRIYPKLFIHMKYFSKEFLINKVN